MATFNACRSGLPQARAWFALLEPGNLCLGLLDHGRWLQVRSLRIGGGWHEELPLILEREAYLADQPAVPHEVYVWDAESDDAAPPQALPWEFHMLSAERIRGGAAPGRWPFLAAMAG